MDRTLAITLCILIAVFAAVAALLGSAAYTEYAYRSTLSGNYTYQFTITTDAPISNVTLFVPVPVDTAGNSPIAAAFSSRTVTGIPAGWDAVLFDTGKTTLVKITAAAIIPPQGTTAARPHATVFTAGSSSPDAIDTRDPVNNSALFRPVSDIREKACPPGQGAAARCFTFTTSVYASYETAPNTTVTLMSAITGKNSWKVFEPASSEYHAETGLSLTGGQHGWNDMPGELTGGIGAYDHPEAR